MFLRKFIGDRDFYKKVLSLAVPIMLQNGISNLVNMIDNIMVGSLGTEQMSGVAIVNQILFVFNLCIFGGIAGIGIFTAQYFGKGDNEGIRRTLRLKLLTGIFILAAALALFSSCGDVLIRSFIHESESAADLALAFKSASDYLKIMMLGLFPFVITNVYSSTLRETEKPMLPMISGIIAVMINLTLNYLLIFGMLGLPALGIRGAAVATVISRISECLIIATASHLSKKSHPYLEGVYKTLLIPISEFKRILPKSLPLLINETFWAAGTAMLTRCYSFRGLDAVAAANICSTITNIFIIAAITFGDSIAIIVGGLLGAGELEKAKDTDRKLIAFSFAVCSALAIILACTSDIYPRAFNTSEISREFAAVFLKCYALYLPFNSLINSCYFTLRCGGKTIVTFLFDSVYMIFVCVPFTYVLAKYTALPVTAVYAGSLAIEVFKVIIGLTLVKKGAWINNLVKSEN